MQNSHTRNYQSAGQQEVPSASTDLLREYERLKFDLASLIRAASSYARDEADDLRHESRMLQTKLAEDRFYLAVVGQSSRGKSTLINALLGMDRLPTGIVPITSVITSVGYGSEEIVKMYAHGWSYGLDVPLEDIADYITEQGNPGNRKNIDLAEIQLPAEILHRGFYLIDTPGFGSAIFENTLTTRKFLPKADAFIFVTSFEAPFSAEELDFFREAHSRGRKVFVVVNKSDLASTQQRDQVLGFLSRRLETEYDERHLTLFALSARDALAAKLDRNPERLTHSGLPALENALVSFLTEEKARQLLVQTCQALEVILASQSNTDLVSIRDRVRKLRARINGERKVDLIAPTQEAAKPGQTLQVRPCTICTEILDASIRFLSGYQYELWRNIDEQQVHAERNGFCAFHTWQYERIASPQGVCSAYPKLLLSLAERLRALLQSKDPPEGFRQSLQELLSDSRQCKMCEAAAEAEKRAIAKFISKIGRSDSSRELRWSLCLRHLVHVLSEISDLEVRQRLVHGISQALQEVAENMQRYALRHEGLRRDLASEEEVHAAQVGITLLVGHRNIEPGSLR
jgi:GTP-binding protein EngB required for normal cell division